MKELLIFGAATLLGMLIPGLLILKRRFRNSTVYDTASAILINGATSIVLGYVVARFGYVHLFWVVPFLIINYIGSISVFMKNVSNKLRSLTGQIQSMAGGRIDFDVDEATRNKKDELGDIARALLQMVTNLKQSIEIVELVAKGHIYTARIKSDDREHYGILDQAMSEMINKLSEIVGEINNGSATVALGAGELKTGSQDVAKGANQQAAAIEEISSSVEEMSSSIGQNADNAKQTEKIALQVVKNIEQMQEVSLNAIESMRTIARQIELINDIAERTDLLAVNAAIEAARAGDFGKGFAIVADEVRNLAENSQEAARSITDLSLQTLNEAAQMSDLIRELIPEIKKTAQLVQEITAASVEQRHGTNQINAAVVQLSEVTQHNAAAAEELAANAVLFAKQAGLFKSTVAFFKLQKRNEKPSKAELIEKFYAFLQEHYPETDTGAEETAPEPFLQANSAHPAESPDQKDLIAQKLHNKGIHINLDPQDNEYEAIT